MEHGDEDGSGLEQLCRRHSDFLGLRSLGRYLRGGAHPHGGTVRLPAHTQAPLVRASVC